MSKTPLTTAEKVEGFRRRLSQAGYQRKEVFVTQDTWKQIQDLAAVQGVGVTDVASGLLEHGLKSYQAASSPRPAQESMPAGALSVSGALSSLSAHWFAAQSGLPSANTRRGMAQASQTGQLEAEQVVSNSVARNVAPNPIAEFFERRSLTKLNK